MRNHQTHSDDSSSETDEVNDNMPTTWMGCKNRGAQLYQSGHYQPALACYQAALDKQQQNSSLASRQERQIVLSNMVACRLKLSEQGDEAAAFAAIQTAQQCITLNPAWAKGHVRLASAYIAAGPGHSNDACNALQTALRLDPGNAVARQMLVRELRRDHAGAAAAAAAATEENEQEENISPQTQRDPPQNPYYRPEQEAEEPRRNNGSDRTTAPLERPDDVPPPNQNNNYFQHDDLDASPTLRERVQFTVASWQQWYQNLELSNDARWLMTAGVVLLVLYVAAGGRFGLDSLFTANSASTGGNYGADNAYEQYRRHSGGNYGADNAYEQYRRTGTAGAYNSRSSSTYSDDHYDSSSYYGGGGGRRRQQQERGGGNYYSSSSYGTTGYNMGDSSSLVSMAMLLAVAYICHLNGINPMHALWMMNAGRRIRGGGRGGYYRGRRGGGFGGYGFGGGGFGYGAGGGGRMHRQRFRW